MTIRITIAALGLVLSMPFAAPALAQSYTAPAGIPAATAPGGVEGRAAVSNLIDAQDGARGITLHGDADDRLLTGSVRGSRGEVVRHAR